MDETGYSIVAQTAAKAATEIYVALVGSGQLPEGGFSGDAWDIVYGHIGQKIIGSAKRAYAAEQQPRPVAPPPGEPGPFDPGQTQPPPPVVSQPVQQSAPAAQPSQPQPVLNGPPCPVCRTPTVLTKDYPAKKARNLAANKAAPPMWKCPMGSYDWNTKTAQGCQGSIWEPDPVTA